jgi:hypothetical protein
MKTSKFDRDNAFGQLAESYVLKLLNGCGLKATPVDFDNRRFWDVQAVVPADWRMPDNLVKLEVKYDKYHQKTHNIAIEIWNTSANRPSGLSSTKSDLWVCLLHDSMWVAKTAYLKAFIFDAGIPPKRVVENAGDGNARIYLYSDSEILSIFHRIDNISSIQAFNKIKELCKRH